MAVKVVLVGGSGFLGSGLQSRLTASGDTVTVIGRNPGIASDRVRAAALVDIVIDCRYPASLARFGAEALDSYTVAR